MIRDAVHRIVDELPDDALGAAAEYLAALRDDASDGVTGVDPGFSDRSVQLTSHPSDGSE
jgi:hypothetical protein